VQYISDLHDFGGIPKWMEYAFTNV